MRPRQTGGPQTYADITLPLRRLTIKSTKFKWTQECEDSFQQLKALLTSEYWQITTQPGRQECMWMTAQQEWQQQ